MMMKKQPLWIFVVYFALVSVACSGETDEAGSGRLFDLEIGAQKLKVETAVTQVEHRKGLMYRASLPEDHGMLFIYQKPTRLRFWMKNVSIPLDIGYFDKNGVLREIYPMHPQTLAAVESRSFELQFALEVNRGWFDRNGIRVGDQIDTAAIAKMLRKRDFAPTLFGL